MLMGKTLIILGVVITGVGLLLMFSDKIPFLGKLPGDISFQKENSRLFFPITSSILISGIISIILWALSHVKGK